MRYIILYKMGFPGDSVVKNPPANAGDTREAGSMPGSGRSSGVGNGNLLQYPSLPYPPASSGSSASPFLVQVAALLSPFTCHPQGVPALLTPGGSPEQKKNSTTCYGRRNMDFGIRPRLGKVPDLWAMMVGPQL